MRVVTSVEAVGFGGRSSFQVDGVPSLGRSDGSASLRLGPGRGLDLSSLPAGAEVTMRLLGTSGSYEDRDVARLRRLADGIEVETAYGTTTFGLEGPDREVPAFAPHAVDVLVDGAPASSVPLADALDAAATFLREVGRLAPKAARTSYEVRRADRLPWRSPFRAGRTA